MNNRSPSRRVFEDADALAGALADAVLIAGEKALAARGRFRLVLNGGGSPRKLFERLGTAPMREHPVWRRTEFFWGDERCVPPDHDGSNFYLARQAFLGRLDLREEQVYRILGELEPAAAAQNYADRLRRLADPGLDWPRFDFVLLGLGGDGHTASLFPGSLEAGGAAALPVRADYDGRPAQRVTLTSAVFNTARRINWLVLGESKAGIVRRVLYGPRDPASIPAQRIRPASGRSTWWLDNGSASKL